MSVTELFSEAHKIDKIDPDAYAANPYSTDWLSMRDFQRLTAIILAGTLGSSATIDAKLEQAKTSGGAGAKDITGKAITQLTQAGTDSDKVAVIELDAAELDQALKFDHVRLTVTVGTATSDMGAVVLRHAASYKPVDFSNLEQVVN